MSTFRNIYSSSTTKFSIGLYYKYKKTSVFFDDAIFVVIQCTLEHHLFDNKLFCADERCIAIVARLIEAGANLDSCALHTVINAGSRRLFDMLLDAGADVNARCGHQGLTPLHCAANATNSSNFYFASRLISAGAHVDSVSMQFAPRDGFGPLVLSARTPCHLAADVGNSDILRLLITSGAPVSTDVLSYSACFHKDVLDILFSAEVSVTLHRVCIALSSFSHISCIETLIHFLPDSERRLLYKTLRFSYSSGNPATLSKVLVLGACCDLSDGRERDYFFYTLRGDFRNSLRIGSNRLNCLQWLFASCDPIELTMARNRYGNSLLHLLALENSTEALACLVAAASNADGLAQWVMAKNHNGHTALDRACKTHGSARMVRRSVINLLTQLEKYSTGSSLCCLPWLSECRREMDGKRREFSLLVFRHVVPVMFLICLALQSLHLPALVTLTILDAVCVSHAKSYRSVPMFLKWNLITAVKHYHDHHRRSTLSVL